jgi:hypothetical protein
MTRLALTIAALVIGGGCQPTGVLLSVHASGVVADQLSVTATFDGRSVVRTRPEAPAPAPLPFPEDLFAEFAARSTTVVFTVQALQRGQPVSTAKLPPLQTLPGQSVSAEIDLPATESPPLGAMPEMGSPYAAVVLADAPIAYYRLDEPTLAGSSALDSSGHGLHGTYGSGVTRSAAGLLAGDSDGAVVFNGGNPSTDAIITVPRNSLLEPAQAVSVELWVRQTVLNSDDATLIVYGDSARARPPYGADLFQGAFNPLLNTTSGTADTSFLTVTKPALSQIYHYVQTYDGQNVRLYVNGVLELTKEFTGPFVGYGSSGLGIGGSTANVGIVFAGTVDEVAIYGVPLTPQQVMTHYSVGAGKALHP